MTYPSYNSFQNKVQSIIRNSKQPKRAITNMSDAKKAWVKYQEYLGKYNNARAGYGPFCEARSDAYGHVSKKWYEVLDTWFMTHDR